MNNDKRPYIPTLCRSAHSTPLLNKGSAFSAEERSSFNLEGLLPETTETIQRQIGRAYGNTVTSKAIWISISTFVTFKTQMKHVTG